MGMTCAVYGVPASKLDALRRDPRVQVRAIREDDELVLPNAGLEKSWHGLHYLMTGSVDSTGGSPLGFLLEGGQSLEKDLGYGGQLFSPAETEAIDASLSALSDEALWSRYDAAAMEAGNVYPMIWDEPEDDLREEYLSYFHELKQVVRTAAQGGMGLLVLIV